MANRKPLPHQNIKMVTPKPGAYEKPKRGSKAMSIPAARRDPRCCAYCHVMGQAMGDAIICPNCGDSL